MPPCPPPQMTSLPLPHLPQPPPLTTDPPSIIPSTYSRQALSGHYRQANNESSEVIDILLPVTFYFNPSTRLDNATNYLLPVGKKAGLCAGRSLGLLL